MPIASNTWMPTSANSPAFAEYMALASKPRVRAKKAPQPEAKEEEVPSKPLDAREGFTFGADPECFIFNADGKAVSAEGLIPGTKSEPFKVDGGAVQVDGMAAEFNINPSSSFKEFNANCEAVIKQLTAMLPNGHTLQFIPSVTFDKAIFDAAPQKAKELGCQPDYNAWEGKVNPPPKDPANPFLRCAGGHLHVGWTEGADVSDAQHIMNCIDLVKQFDWYLGGWSLQFDKDNARRRLYGKAGACRLKDYGVEYRVLSNFWAATRDQRLRVWNRMQLAIEAMAKGFIPDKARGYNDILRENINEGKLAPVIRESYRYPLVSLTR